MKQYKPQILYLVIGRSKKYGEDLLLTTYNKPEALEYLDFCKKVDTRKRTFKIEESLQDFDDVVL